MSLIQKLYFNELKDKLAADTDPEVVYRKAQKSFFMRPFKLLKINFEQAEISFNKLLKKYQEKVIQIWENDWHKNQRKLFIQILVWYCDVHRTTPDRMKQQEWEYLGSLFFRKHPMFLKFQGLNLLQFHEKIIWDSLDDQILKENIKRIGQGNWNQISKSIFFDSDYNKFIPPKQCRERWFNHLSQKINRGKWTPKEDLVILTHINNKNKRWCEIVKELDGTRTQHMVKNRYTCLVQTQFRGDNRRESFFINGLIDKLNKKIKKSKITGIQTKNNLQDSVKIKKSQKQSQSRRLPQKINANYIRSGLDQIGVPEKESVQQGPKNKKNKRLNAQNVLSQNQKHQNPEPQYINPIQPSLKDSQYQYPISQPTSFSFPYNYGNIFFFPQNQILQNQYNQPTGTYINTNQGVFPYSYWSPNWQIVGLNSQIPK